MSGLSHQKYAFAILQFIYFNQSIHPFILPPIYPDTKTKTLASEMYHFFSALESNLQQVNIGKIKHLYNVVIEWSVISSQMTKAIVESH